MQSSDGSEMTLGCINSLSFSVCENSKLTFPKIVYGDISK